MDPRDDGSGRLDIKHADGVEWEEVRLENGEAVTVIRRAWVVACDGHSVTVDTPAGPLTLERRRVRKVG